MGWNHMNGWNWLWMGPVMVAFWAAVAIGIVMMARRSGVATGGRLAASSNATPEEMLGQRLAKGDIDVEDYRQRLEALRHSPRN